MKKFVKDVILIILGIVAVFFFVFNESTYLLYTLIGILVLIIWNYNDNNNDNNDIYYNVN